jgi:hypothetical protein
MRQHAMKGAGKELTPANGGQGDSVGRQVQEARLGALMGLVLALDLAAIAFEIGSSSEPSPASLMSAWMGPRVRRAT